MRNVSSKIHNSQCGNVWIDSSNINLIFEEFVDRGYYGALALCIREDRNTGQKNYVFAKVPIDKYTQLDTNNSFLWEACIQILVRKTLERHGFKNGAPRVLDIFRLKDGRICFTMENIIGSKALDIILENVESTVFSNIVTEGIVQMASMISILEKELGFNHRDLRAANILCREISPEMRKLVIWDEKANIESKNSMTTSYKGYEIKIKSTYEYTLIDFGFVCFGKCKNGCNNFSLKQNVYDKLDHCPKPGRDLFMLLSFLLAEFDSKMNPELRKYFKKWLDPSIGIELPISVAKPGHGLYKFIRRYGLKADKWIYFIVKHRDIRSLSSTNAIKIIEDLGRTE